MSKTKKADKDAVIVTPGPEKQETFSLARIETPELLADVVKEYGLELPDSKVDSHLRTFLPYVSKLVELETEMQAILTAPEITPELSERAKALRGEYRTVRTGADGTKATEKKDMIIEGRFLDKINKTIADAASSKEEKCSEVEKHIENLENERIEALKKDRREKLEALDYDTEFLNLSEMTDESFNRLLKKAEEAKLGADALKQQQEAEQARLAEEQKKRQEQEQTVRNRMAQVTAIGLIYDESNRNFTGPLGRIDQDVLEFFNDADFAKHFDPIKKRFDEDKKSKDEALKAEQEKSQRITNRINAITALGMTYNTATEQYEGYGQSIHIKHVNEFAADNFKDELDRVKSMVDKEKARLKKIDDEAKAETVRLQQAEAKRKEQEQQAAEQKRLLALAPDKDKFKAFYTAFKEFKAPEMTSDAGKQLTVKINGEFEAMRKRLIALANELK
jgi:hypothetical protein